MGSFYYIMSGMYCTSTLMGFNEGFMGSDSTHLWLLCGVFEMYVEVTYSSNICQFDVLFKHMSV
jgi:hypothetical protein